MNTKFSIRGSVLAMTLLIAFTSCDVTDLEPQSFFSETSAFSTVERAELAAIGMYNAAQSGFYLGSFTANRGYPFGAANVQQNEMRGEDMINQALFYAITYESTFSPFTANNVEMFSNLFALVNQANVVIEGATNAITSGLLTAEVANGYIGEARFLRALAYHEMAIHFSRPYLDGNGSNPGMPIRRNPVTSGARVEEGLATGRSTVAQNYAFILEDLDFAEANLPATRPSFNRVTRATRGAAIALKTRVKLHMGDWAGVIAEGNKLLGGSAYSLTATVRGPFSKTSTEAVFYIDNATVDNPGVNGALASMFGSPSKNGRGLVLISPELFNDARWLDDDERRTLLVKTTSGSSQGYFTDKYTDIVGRSDPNPLLRFAEVILNVAEAEARSSAAPSQRALDLLNQVRNRAVKVAADQFTINDFADAKELVAAILFERRIEFSAEGRRWPDIHRLANDPDHTTGGIPAKIRYSATMVDLYDLVNRPTITKTIPFIPYSDNRFLWPIPATELAQNPDFGQNPGY